MNKNLFFIGNILILILLLGLICTSGCIDEDTSSINMAEVIAQQKISAESEGQILETVSIPVPGGIVRPVTEYIT